MNSMNFFLSFFNPKWFLWFHTRYIKIHNYSPILSYIRVIASFHDLKIPSTTHDIFFLFQNIINHSNSMSAHIQYVLRTKIWRFSAYGYCISLPEVSSCIFWNGWVHDIDRIKLKKKKSYPIQHPWPDGRHVSRPPWPTSAPTCSFQKEWAWNSQGTLRPSRTFLGPPLC